MTENECSSNTAPKDTSVSPIQHPDRRASSQSTQPSGPQSSATSKTHLPPDAPSGTSLVAEPPLPQLSHSELNQSKAFQHAKEITITIPLPVDHTVDGGPPQFGAASFQTTIKPEDVRRLLGIPEFQPREQQTSYTGQRNYNYEEKYPADVPNQENESDARFFKVYLDEAEIFDQEKIRSHRDNLDSLLVFAALFSAIVTTFVVQTSQALQPDQGLITNYLLLQQIEILKVISNATAVAALAPSQYLPDTITHSRSDIWVNCFFFTSLSLSVSTALLSVLAKQWLQAYDSSTSGSARDRALIRHLRFMGLTKWKLDEIIGVLPIVLHISFAVFIIGLTVFLWSLYHFMAYIVIVITGISFTLYLASIIMPAIDIECPYRIPLLYRPMRYTVLFLSSLYGKLRAVGKWLWSIIFKRFPVLPIPRSTLAQLYRIYVFMMYIIQDSFRIIQNYSRKATTSALPSLSLQDAEQSTVQDKRSSSQYLHYSIAWLHEMSSNTSVRRVAAQAIGGILCHPEYFEIQPTPASFSILCKSSIMRTVADGFFDGEDVSPYPRGADEIANHPSPWIRAMESLSLASRGIPNTPFPQHALLLGLGKAAGMGRVNHMRYILDQFRDMNVDIPLPAGSGLPWGAETALFAASHNGHISNVRLLLDYGADVNVYGGKDGSPLQAASRMGHTEVVKLLLENGANVNFEGGPLGPALHAASCCGHLEIVNLLIEEGADLDMEGGVSGSALKAASYHGNLDIVELLLEEGADVNMGGEQYGSALQAAASQNHLKVVKFLLMKGADVNARGGEHGSALQAASYQDHLKIVKLLLRKGADVNMGGGKYGPALQAASGMGHLEVVEFLLEKGADVNMRGGEYGSALQAASAMGRLVVVELLLEKGADVNVGGGECGPALQLASQANELKIVELLLEKGADVNIGGGGGHGSALQDAIAHGHRKVAELLRNNGAV